MYRLKYRHGARNYLARLPLKTKTAIINTLHALVINPDDSDPDVRALNGRAGFRLRVGQYRIIYTRRDDELVIEVVTVRPRGDVYGR
ncbi:MAG: type II toxin-antitoxin system RelE/ParE family toxin [Deltaproteobacteria bacterium]|nr:type II toxin-antitoxin system RelE/ParE family toxin [Deltaproteobacteria bacterium]